jgi:hypothetical protein
MVDTVARTAQELTETALSLAMKEAAAASGQIESLLAPARQISSITDTSACAR